VPVAKRLATKEWISPITTITTNLSATTGTLACRTVRLAAPQILKAEIDTYWIQAGGGDPVEWIRKCPDASRCSISRTCASCRDRQIRDGGDRQRQHELARHSSRQQKECGVEWHVVEQDECYGRDPFESLAISYQY